MVEEVSEGLPEERPLVDSFLHWAASTRPRPSNMRRYPAIPNKPATWEKWGPALPAMFSESLSFPLLYLFWSLSFCHSDFNVTLSWPVLLYQMWDGEWKEADLTWPGTGYPMQARELGSKPAVTRGDWLLQIIFHDYSVVMYPEKLSNSYTSPAFHSLILSPFLVYIYYQKQEINLYSYSHVPKDK